MEEAERRMTNRLSSQRVPFRFLHYFWWLAERGAKRLFDTMLSKMRMHCELTLSMSILSGSRLKPSLVRPCEHKARVPKNEHAGEPATQPVRIRRGPETLTLSNAVAVPALSNAIPHPSTAQEGGGAATPSRLAPDYNQEPNSINNYWLSF